MPKTNKSKVPLKNSSGFSKLLKNRWFLIAVVCGVALVGMYFVYQSFAATLPRKQYRDITYQEYRTVHRMRTWRNARVYNLENGQTVKVLPPLSIIEVTKIATKDGGYFYVLKPSTVNGAQWYGVYVNTAYRINSAGRAINKTGGVLPMRNQMPITNQLATGGECTAARVWYNGLNNNLVAALQRVQLHTGREIPFTTAYRTYDEQVCLWNKFGQNPARVARPGTSQHNRGLAVDVGTEFANITGMNDIFRQFGLCRTVPAEPWHYELCQ